MKAIRIRITAIIIGALGLAMTVSGVELLSLGRQPLLRNGWRTHAGLRGGLIQQQAKGLFRICWRVNPYPRMGSL